MSTQFAWSAFTGGARTSRSIVRFFNRPRRETLDVNGYVLNVRVIVLGLNWAASGTAMGPVRVVGNLAEAQILQVLTWKDVFTKKPAKQ